MSTLIEKANKILDEKIAKIKPENIKNGVEVFGVTGTLTGEGTQIEGVEFPDTFEYDPTARVNETVLNITNKDEDIKYAVYLYSSWNNWESQEYNSYGHTYLNSPFMSENMGVSDISIYCDLYGDFANDGLKSKIEAFAFKPDCICYHKSIPVNILKNLDYMRHSAVLCNSDGSPLDLPLNIYNNFEITNSQRRSYGSN